MRLSKLLLVLLIVLALNACKSEKDKLPDAGLMEEMTDYAPLASIQTQKTVLESLDSSQILSLIPRTPPDYSENVFHRAFILGRMTTDLYLATLLKSTAHYTAYTSVYTKLASDLRWELQRDAVDNSMKDLYRQRDWQEMQKAVELLKQNYESEAWSNESYELYTLFLLGQWIELTDILTDVLISSKASLDKSSFLLPELFTTLLDNLQITQDQELIQSSFFEPVYDSLTSLKAAYEKLPESLQPDNLEEIRRLSQAILIAFSTTE